MHVTPVDAEFVSPTLRGVLASVLDGQGHCLANALSDGTIELLSVTEGFRLIKRLYGPSHAISIRRLAFVSASPFDNKFLISAGLDGYLRLWSVGLEKVISTQESHGGPIYDMVVSNNQIYVGCHDGGVRLFSLDVASDLVSQMTLDDSQTPQISHASPPSITLVKTLTKESQDTHILSLAYTPTHLYYGTSIATVMAYDLKQQRSLHKVQLSRSRKRKLREVSIEPPEGENVFEFLDRVEQLKKRQEEEHKSQAAKAVGEVWALMFVEEDNCVIAGDLTGRVTVIDCVTMTIMKEFIRHSACVTGLLKLCEETDTLVVASVGADGRVCTYMKHLDSTDPDWIMGVSRFAHLSDCTCVIQSCKHTPHSVIVPGTDGCVAIYREGLNDLKELDVTPTRIANMNTRVKRDPKRRLVLEIGGNGVVSLWTFIKESASALDAAEIIELAQASLSNPNLKSIDTALVLESLKSDEWSDIKIGEIDFSEESVMEAGERLVDACLLSDDAAALSMVVKQEETEAGSSDAHLYTQDVSIVVATMSSIRLFKFNSASIALEEKPLPSNIHSQLIKKSTRRYTAVHDLSSPGLVAIGFVNVKTDGVGLNYGFIIASLKEESLICTVDELSASVSSFEIQSIPDESVSLLCVHLTDGHSWIFKSAPETRVSKAWQRMSTLCSFSLPARFRFKSHKFNLWGSAYFFIGNNMLFTYDLKAKQFCRALELKPPNGGTVIDIVQLPTKYPPNPSDAEGQCANHCVFLTTRGAYIGTVRLAKSSRMKMTNWKPLSIKDQNDYVLGGELFYLKDDDEIGSRAVQISPHSSRTTNETPRSEEDTHADDTDNTHALLVTFRTTREAMENPQDMAFERRRYGAQ